MAQCFKKTKTGPSPIDIHVGLRLRTRRSLLGLSQQALGKKGNVKARQIHKYESGINRISAGRLWEFSKILAVPIEYFYQGLEQPDPLETALRGLSDAPQSVFKDNFFIEPENFEILGNYHKIKDQELKSDLRRFLKSMARAYA